MSQLLPPSLASSLRRELRRHRSPLDEPIGTAAKVVLRGGPPDTMAKGLLATAYGAIKHGICCIDGFGRHTHASRRRGQRWRSLFRRESSETLRQSEFERTRVTGAFQQSSSWTSCSTTMSSRTGSSTRPASHRSAMTERRPRRRRPRHDPERVVSRDATEARGSRGERKN